MSIIETQTLHVCGDCVAVAFGDTSGIGTEKQEADAIDAFCAGMSDWSDVYAQEASQTDDPAPMVTLVEKGGEDTGEFFSWFACQVCGSKAGMRQEATLMVTD